jgi:hypothetical protein
MRRSLVILFKTFKIACSLLRGCVIRNLKMLISFTSKVAKRGVNKIIMLLRILYYIVYNRFIFSSLKVVSIKF